MTVQDLIKKLQQYDPNTQVCLGYTDPTDWDYVCEIEEKNFTMGNVIVDTEYTEDSPKDITVNYLRIEVEENQSII